MKLNHNAFINANVYDIGFSVNMFVTLSIFEMDFIILIKR